LWWQLHRLRCAIEVDCDARVLDAGLDTGQYGETLIDVSQRPSDHIGSVAAMSESRSFLERRIAIMVRRPGELSSVATVLFGSVPFVLVAVAAQAAPPNFDTSHDTPQVSTLTPTALEQYVGFYLRGANIIVTITRDGTHLLFKAPTYPAV